MIRKLAVRALARPPVWGVLRKRALAGSPVTILCYHTLGPDRGGIDGWTVVRCTDFREQLADLKRYYDIVSLDDALAGTPRSGRPQAVITFDDGDVGLFVHLRPILAETPVPVTVYVATSQIETGRPFWFDRVVNALQRPGEIAIDGLGRWHMPGAGSKAHWAVLGSVLQALKDARPELRDALADQVAAQGTHPEGPALGPMSIGQLQDLATVPGVTIGAHSHGHELLDQIPPEAAWESAARSRSLLQGWTGQEVRHFAYPNGNFTPALCTMIQDLGFASATILDEHPAARDSDPFALPRISVGRYDSRDRVRLRLAGL